MKNLLILIITIFALCGCVENSQINTPNQKCTQLNIPKRECNKVKSNFGKIYNVVEIDSCEYLVKHSNTYYGHDVISITHKGNCKYCRERNRQMVKDILTAIDYE